MRIGIVTENYASGAGEIGEQVANFAREARRLGHRVRVLTGGTPDPRGARGPDVIRLGRSRPVLRNGGYGRITHGAGLAEAMRTTLARERFDVVHVHSPLSPVLPLLALHYASGPVVGTFHAKFVPGLFFRLARRTLQRYLDRLDAAVAVSRACLSAFRGRLRAEFQIIPNGVDAEQFGRGRRLRRFDDGRLNVLWVGHPEPRDGLDRMIAAFARVWGELDARLIVLGAGPLLPRYQALIPPHMAADVFFAGEAFEGRPDWYATADVVCVSARAASFGARLLEGMAAGKPVLASDIDGFRELLRPGKEGELVDPDDPNAWARSIMRLAREPVRAASYGEQGRHTAAQYAWPGLARQILGLYRSIGVHG